MSFLTIALFSGTFPFIYYSTQSPRDRVGIGMRDQPGISSVVDTTHIEGN